MALFQESTSTNSTMETSNFAHVIFQNVGKSYIPQAALECHYTLTQFIKPHQKDWVGIFKVGWSTARDYHTFLWSPFPENYVEGTTVNRVVVFQGYYVPNDDGEFYQFCYVTHKGEIRGASTPFQFRASHPNDDLLTVEDENNSDILVVTTKAGLLEKKVEEAQKEKEELVKAMGLLQQEKQELQEAKEKVQREWEQEREACTQLKRENQELQSTSLNLQEEREEVKRRHQEVTARVHQLEEDLMGVTQKGIQKETELDCLRDRVKKLTLEKDTLESQLQNEREEKELYKVHLKNRELETRKLTAELQTQKVVDVNKENMITQLKEELGRVRACLTEKEKLQREILSNASPSSEKAALKEQLRQTEEQLQATRQHGAMLASELRDVSSARDRSISELHRLRVEMEALRMSQADAQAQRSRLEEQLDSMKAAAQQETGGADGGAGKGAEAELQREVEDLKLRLHMAAEHYKEKYKECQKLQRQVAKLSEQQGELKKSAVASGGLAAEVPGSPQAGSPQVSVQGSPTSSHVALDTFLQEKLKGISKEATEKSDKYKKCKQMLSEEKERSCMFADELAKMEVKWKEQLKVNESLKLQLAAEEDRYKSQVAEKGREVKELKENLALLVKEKEKLEEELQKRAEAKAGLASEGSSLESSPPMFLQYPLPYTHDALPAPLVAQQSTELQFGNPYSTGDTRDGADGEFSSDQVPRLPPVGPPSWDSNVVCIQPSRNLSRPDGLEDPEEHNNGGDVEQPVAGDLQSPLLNDSRARFCFDSSMDIHKRCPLCEVIFPPNYDQSKFEEHVESHWKVCPMCSEQFPLDCDQQLFEKHVLTHFDGNVLNFT